MNKVTGAFIPGIFLLMGVLALLITTKSNSLPKASGVDTSKLQLVLHQEHVIDVFKFNVDGFDCLIAIRDEIRRSGVGLHCFDSKK